MKPYQKPYQQVPIQDCGEPLIQIPACFGFIEPHPYVKLAAPYGDRSPYYLRHGVLKRLEQAQTWLQQQCPDWQIQIFDAYRPIPVQQFMVGYTLEQVLRASGLSLQTATESQRQQALEQVQQFWAMPSLNPATPPPHSTGAAVDVTLISPNRPVEMGSPIDELSPRSFPGHFATATTPEGEIAHQNRILLHSAMAQAGFEQHPQEWWHFSYGDQLWAWLVSQKQPETATSQPVAKYGAAEFSV